jgi:4-amino-4-deoxy-L-arabinose transferase-like glycosyltransferase
VWGDRGLVLLLGAALFLPNLGGFALWEEDEAHNAGCTKEMIAAQTWVVPSFNYVLRTDKPALLYWWQRLAYHFVGVNEWGARLPSALASMLSLLLVYEIGRHWRGPATGRWAALLLGTMLMFGVLAKAATPDGLLIATVLGCFYCRVRAEESQTGRWLLAYGLCSGLAVLAKGPVGLALPTGIIGLHLIWQRQLGRLWSWHLLGGIGLLALVALPWFIAVGVETRFAFWRGFFGQHNVGRFLRPMEGHGGGWWLQPLLLLATTAPWSAFIGWLWWSRGAGGSWRDLLRPASGPEALARLFALWLVIWVGFFSLAATKLPNYLAPAFAPLALLLADVLLRWRAGRLPVPGWAVRASLAILILIGLGLSSGMVVASGVIPIPALRGRIVPGLLPWAWLGLILALAGGWAWRAWLRHDRDAVLYRVGLGVGGFSLLLAAVLPAVLDTARAPKPLALALRQHQIEREVLLASHARYLPSLVFYTGHQLRRSLSDDEAVVLLEAPVQVFLVVGERDWPRLAARVSHGVYVVARHFDFKAGQALLLVTNRTTLAGSPAYNSDVSLEK